MVENITPKSFSVNTPLVSVIMPAYNAAEYLELAIASVKSQTFRNWELIVIDDGSSDNTCDIVKGIVNDDPRVILLQQPNGKQARARNNGMRHARGKWIAFLDADDLWFPEKLEKQLQFAQAYPQADLIYSGGVILNEEDKSEQNYPIIDGLYTGQEMYRNLYITNYIPILSVLVKKECIDSVGFQDEDFQISTYEDWDYWVRIAKAGFVFFGIKDQLFKYRIHPGGSSRRYYYFRAAEAIALYKNMDVTLIDESALKIRLSEIIHQILPDLISTKEIALSKRLAFILMNTNNHWKNNLLHFALKFHRHTPMKVIYFLLK